MLRRKSAPEPVSVRCGDELWGRSATFSARRQPGLPKHSLRDDYRRGPAVLEACASSDGGSASGRVRTGRTRSDAGANVGCGMEVGVHGMDASLSVACRDDTSRAGQTMGAAGDSRRAAGTGPRTRQPIYSSAPLPPRVAASPPGSAMRVCQTGNSDAGGAAASNASGFVPTLTEHAASRNREVWGPFSDMPVLPQERDL